MSQATASKALSKYKVLDLTRARAGPTAVRQLADWGAQVIKIELPGSDDTPDFMDRHSPDFQNLHRNKRSMTLNLKHPEGLDIFKQLAWIFHKLALYQCPAWEPLLGGRI